MFQLVCVCAGDEVLEWNGRSLEHKSYDEVHDVIAESRYDSQVELRVSRMLSAPGSGAAAAAAAAGMAGHGHPIRGGPVPSRPLAAPTGTRIQVGKVFSGLIRVLLNITLTLKDSQPLKNPFFYFKGQRPVLFCVFLRKNLTALKLFGMI